jgi:hypothetical protein
LISGKAPYLKKYLFKGGKVKKKACFLQKQMSRAAFKTRLVLKEPFGVLGFQDLS